jgi:hypothetical protein
VRRGVCNLLPCVLLLFPACDSLTGTDGAERARLAQSRSRWRVAAIRDYSYQLGRVCFCPPDLVGPFRITVRGGELSSVIDLGTGMAAIPNPQRHPTVEGLFDQIDAALDRDPDKIEVVYDSALGYPTRIAVDFVAMAVDDEVTYSATELSPLK